MFNLKIKVSTSNCYSNRLSIYCFIMHFRKLRCLHDRQIKYSINFKDKESLMAANSQINSTSFKEKNTEGVDSDVESAEDSDHESEITQPEEVSWIRHLLLKIKKSTVKEIN